MNWKHLATIVWLRWRLGRNQINKLGWTNRILLWIVVVVSLLFGASNFFATFGLLSFVLPRVFPDWMLFVLDGAVLMFLFSWMIGILTDLQRSEALSLDKFLHLPISPRGVFLLNYFSSLINLSMVVFFPIFLGVTSALMWRYGFAMTVSLVLMLAFFLMVTAITYQFRGWLASIMINKRRRRLVITLVTIGVVLLSQIPNVLDLTLFRGRDKEADIAREADKRELAEIAAQVDAGTITQSEADERRDDVERRKNQRRGERFSQLIEWTRQANAFVPFFWMTAGTDGVAHQRWWPAIGGLAGMLAISGVSLWRSYRTTLRLYRGGFDSGRRLVAKPGDETQPNSSAAEIQTVEFGNSSPMEWTGNFIESRVPILTEHQSTIALMWIRSLTRAPESLLAILAPVVVILFIGGMLLLRGEETVPPEWRPLAGLGICFVAMIGISQLIQNQFGFDRDGFRFILLAPINERDVLIGKNMAVAPVAVGLATVALIAMQFASPMAWSHFAATFIQLGNMFIVAALVGNLMSIYVPMAVSSGSLKPTNMKFGAVVLQFVIFLLAPAGMIPALAPLGIELLVANDPFWGSVPIYLLGAACYFAVLCTVYLWVVSQQAAMLRQRKWKILESITRVGA